MPRALYVSSLPVPGASSVGPGPRSHHILKGARGASQNDSAVVSALRKLLVMSLATGVSLAMHHVSLVPISDVSIPAAGTGETRKQIWVTGQFLGLNVCNRYPIAQRVP